MPARFPLKSLSLQKRMVLLLALGMFIILGVMGVSSFLSVRQTLQRSLQERLLLAQNVAGHLDYIIRQNLIRLQDISFPRGVDLQDDNLEPEKLALHNAYLNSIFNDGVFLLDGKGIVLWREPPRSGIVGQRFADFPHVKEVFATGRPVVSNLFSLPQTGKKMVTALMPLRGWEGRILGVVGGDIDPTNSRLLEALKVIKMGNTGYIDLVDAEGVVLASTKLSRILEKSDHEHYLADLIKNKKSAVSTCHRCHEEPTTKRETEVIAFAPLAEVPWGVTIRQSEREVLAPAKTMARRFLLFGIPLIAMALIVAGGTAKSVTKPIETLTAAAKRISQGDLEEPIPFMGDDEIGHLGKSFDIMRSRLKGSLDQINRWNRELEEKVRKRTVELEESRDYLQTIVDSLDDQLIVVDSDMKVTCANASLLNRLGLPQDQVIGLLCHEVSHNSISACHDPHCGCPAKEVWETGKPKRIVHTHRQDGAGSSYIEVIASPIKNQQGEVVEVVELFRDITEEEELGQEVLRRNRELSLLNTIAMVVTGSHDLEETLEYSVDRMLELASVECGGIYLWEGDPPVLRPAIFKGLSEKAAAKIGMLIQEGLIPDSAEALGQQDNPQALTHNRLLNNRELVSEGFLSYLHVHLIAKGKTLGSVWLATRGDRKFTVQDVSLLSSVGGQIAVAIENAALYEEVQRKEELRGELLKKVISAQEEERKRIARELHDETSQALVALMVAIERAMMEQGDAKHKKRMEEMKGLVVSTLDGVHSLIHDLRPSVLDDLGLQSAIRWYTQSRLDPLGINFNIQITDREVRLPGQMETVLFRIVQEAITNIIKHSGAEDVKISLAFADDSVTVTIEDNGSGFDVEEVTADQRHKAGGFGLLGMQERVSLLEGTLHIYSDPAEGTRIVIIVPYSTEEVAGA